MNTEKINTERRFKIVLREFNNDYPHSGVYVIIPIKQKENILNEYDFWFDYGASPIRGSNVLRSLLRVTDIKVTNDLPIVYHDQFKIDIHPDNLVVGVLYLTDEKVDIFASDYDVAKDKYAVQYSDVSNVNIDSVGLFPENSIINIDNDTIKRYDFAVSENEKHINMIDISDMSDGIFHAGTSEFKGFKKYDNSLGDYGISSELFKVFADYDSFFETWANNYLPQYNEQLKKYNIEKFVKNYKSYISKNNDEIIAVDFDGCVIVNRYGDKMVLRDGVATALDFLNRLGYTLILWTTRSGKCLDEAIDFMGSIYENFSWVNMHDYKNIKKYDSINNGILSPKVYADHYIDDRFHFGGFQNWELTFENITKMTINEANRLLNENHE